MSKSSPPAAIEMRRTGIVARWQHGYLAGDRFVPLRSLGRGMQVLALALPPLAMVLQLAEAITLGQMLTMLVAAVCLFLIGRITEGYSR